MIIYLAPFDFLPASGITARQTVRNHKYGRYHSTYMYMYVLWHDSFLFFSINATTVVREGLNFMNVGGIIYAMGTLFDVMYIKSGFSVCNLNFFSHHDSKLNINNVYY